MGVCKTGAFTWSKVDSRDKTGCWPWLGPKNRHGYGACKWKGKNVNASRAALESSQGDIPEGMFACHHCDNRACCNPAHLYVGTPLENVQDKFARGCPAGMMPAGIHHPRHTAKLSEDDVRSIRERHRGGESQSSIAREYGMSSMQMSKICRRVAWRHVV